MSKEAVIIQEFNEKERKYEYFVKGFEVTESVKILLKRHKEEYDKEKNIFAGTQGFIEAQQLYEKQISDLEAKLAESEEDLQATKESLYASREYLEELKSEKWGLEKALELAVEELDDAKDMLRECNKNELASLLNTSVDYFKARGKEVENDRK